MLQVKIVYMHNIYICDIFGEAIKLRIKIQNEQMMADGGLLKWIDPDMMTGQNQRTMIRNTTFELCITHTPHTHSHFRAVLYSYTSNH